MWIQKSIWMKKEKRYPFVSCTIFSNSDIQYSKFVTPGMQLSHQSIWNPRRGTKKNSQAPRIKTNTLFQVPSSVLKGYHPSSDFDVGFFRVIAAHLWINPSTQNCSYTWFSLPVVNNKGVKNLKLHCLNKLETEPGTSNLI